MKIDLKKKTLLNRSDPFKVIISDRLPSHLPEAVELTCCYEVKQEGRVLILKLMQHGVIKTVCQRCLTSFDSDFKLETEIEVCSSDEIAREYQELYDVIVAADNQIELNDILVDNLYLFSENLHDNLELCDLNQIKLMQSD